MKTNKEIIKNYLPIILIGGIFLLILHYALLIGVTHDEAFTFNYYSHQRIGQIALDRSIANNHILNSILVKYFTQTLGVSTFTLRLPNIISGFFFLLFLYKILSVIFKKNLLLISLSFLIICLNQYLLLFFGLARGYGMALSFFTISLYFALNFNESKDAKNALLVSFFSCLSVWSNFTYLYLFAAIHIWMFANFFIDRNGFRPSSFNEFFKTFIYGFLNVIIWGAVVYRPLKYLSEGTEVYNKNLTSFWNNTIGYLYHTSIDFKPRHFISETAFIIYAKIVGAIIICFWLIKVYKSFKNKLFDHSFLFIAVLVLTSLLMKFHHLASGVDMINGRKANFYFVLIPLSYFLIVSSFRQTKINIILLLIPLFLVTYNFSFKYRDIYISDWVYDASTETMLEDLKDMIDDPSKHEYISLGINWLYEPAINFCKKGKRYDWLKKVDRSGPIGNYDYYYLFNPPLENINLDSLEIVKRYPASGSVLAKRK